MLAHAAWGGLGILAPAGVGVGFLGLEEHPDVGQIWGVGITGVLRDRLALSS